jgi:type IV pilus biogenesis protein CpaD/CtpE
LKSIPASLLALTVAAVLAGCAKEPASTSAAAPEAAPAAQPATPPMTEPHPMPASPTEEVDLTGIAKADGGKTVAEVFAEKDQLAGQQVVLRGKVVKSNPGIMGKNWIHVRDGSGAEGTNDLTVTTTGAGASVGDTVLVKGPVSLHRDLGMGYVYDVIVEDAEVTVEESAP